MLYITYIYMHGKELIAENSDLRVLISTETEPKLICSLKVEQSPPQHKNTTTTTTTTTQCRLQYVPIHLCTSVNALVL